MMVGARAHFCAGHKLPQHSEVHGHSYEVWAFAAEGPDAEAWQEIIRIVCADLDHRMLNDIIDPPTMENIARHVAAKTGAQRVQIVRPVEGLSAEWSALTAGQQGS